MAAPAALSMAGQLTGGQALAIQGMKSGGSLLGNLINVGFQWYAMNKQIAENRRAEQLGLRIRDEDIARSEFWKTKEWDKFTKQFGLQEKQFGLQEDMFDLNREKFDWEKDQSEWSKKNYEDDRRYKRIMDFTTNFQKLLGRNQSMRNNLINRYRGGR